MQLDDKLVVVTGSGRGIGRAMAFAFALKRSNLALLDLDAAGLAETQGTLRDSRCACAQLSVPMWHARSR